MSPAVAEGKAEDTRCDIYAFGAMLYEMLTGHPPYNGEDPHALLETIKREPPVPILTRSPEASVDLATIAEAAMARELHDRYASMADVVADLDRVADGRKPLGAHGHASRRGAGPYPLAWRLTLLLVTSIAALVVWYNSDLPSGGWPGNGSTPMEPAVIQGGEGTPWKASLVQAEHAYEAGRFEEAARHYDDAMTAMADDTRTARELLASRQAVSEKRRDLAEFIVDRNGLNAQEQIDVTQTKLRELNPKYLGGGRFVVRDGQVVEARFTNCEVRDVSPLRGLPLEKVSFWGTPVEDIRPLADLPLSALHLSLTPIKTADTAEQQDLLVKTVTAFDQGRIDEARDLLPKFLDAGGTPQMLVEANAAVNVAKKGGETLLHEAAGAGDGRLVAAMLAAGANPRARRVSDQSTPMLQAVYANSVEAVQAFLDAGVGIDEPINRYGVTALYCAADWGRVDVARHLIRSGANPRAPRPDDQTTPMYRAAYAKSSDIVQALLDAGLGPNESVYRNGEAALHSASYWGHVEVARLLLRAGAAPSARRPGDAVTPMYQAVHANCIEIIQALLDAGVGVDEPVHKNGGTALHWAARWGGRLESVELLVEAGADINARDSASGSTPLTVAAAENHVPTMETLVAAGADLEARQREGKTALAVAAQNRRARATEVLLKAGANVDGVDKEGNTALHHAVYRGALDVVQALVEAGAAVDLPDNGGRTALQDAAVMGFPRVAEYLIHAGATVDARDHQGKTPLHYAVDTAHADVVDVLFACGANVVLKTHDGTTALHYAASRGHVDVLRKLLAKGADPTARKNDGWTPLHDAVSVGALECVEALLDAGVGIEISGQNDKTPLHRAAEAGRADSAKMLLAKGAEISAMTDSEDTPLHLAAERGHLDVARELLGAGADPTIRNSGDKLPVDVATDTGVKDLLRSALNGR